MKKHLVSAAAITATAALVLTGCAGGDGGNAAPIKLGAVSTISGPATFPEASAAAQAVFDRVNAEGGINGRQIEYKVMDDKADPATATAAARELVGGDEVVALVGSASLLDCEVNAKYYESENIRAVQGLGVDPGCFSSPNIAPVNIGPYNDTTLTMLYGSEVLGLDNLCVFTSVIGSTGPAYTAAIERWSEVTGKEPLMVDDTVPYGGSDYTPYIVKAKEAGCEAIVSNAVEPDGIGQIKAANQQGWDDVSFLFLTSVYSESFAAAVENAGNGVFVPTEYYPLSLETDVNADWRELMTENDIVLSSFAVGGYLAATILVDVLKGIEGDITRDSVNEALKNMEPVNNPLIAYPYQFDKIAAQDYQPGGWPVELKSGTKKWEPAADDWLMIPKN